MKLKNKDYLIFKKKTIFVDSIMSHGMCHLTYIILILGKYV